LGDNTFWSNTSLRQAIFQAGRPSAPIEKVVDRYPHVGDRAPRLVSLKRLEDVLHKPNVDVGEDSAAAFFLP
jgi:hypothetical protein